MISIVVISPDDSEGVVLAKVMNLHIVIRSDCFGPGICLVLAKEMKSAKEIRSDDKKRGAAPAAGLLADDCLSGGRRCKEVGPAAGVGGAGGGGQGAGAMVCRGWMGRAMFRRRSAAAIRMYLIGD